MTYPTPGTAGASQPEPSDPCLVVWAGKTAKAGMDFMAGGSFTQFMADVAQAAADLQACRDAGATH